MKTKRPILLRWPQRLVRAAAWAVLLTFSANIVTPTLVLARDVDRSGLMSGPKRTQSDDVTDTLIQLEEALQRMNRRLQGGWEYEWQEIANRGGQTPPPAAADRAALRALEDELDAAVPRLESLQGHVRAFFAQTRKHIDDANLAPEIMSRHDDSVREYEASYAQLKSLLHALKTAHTLDEFKTAVAAADAFMQAHSSKPKRSTFDPNAPLAFGPVKSKAPEARTDAKAMRKALGIAEPTAKALARQADAKAAPTAAELAETEDAQFTPAIRAKAQELGNSPVAIYNFVRNNVEFMPTYGSIQGADQTLKTLRGNAFDQSSLLIALLRAANVPSRYVFGTIEVPIEQVQNWVGGTETPQAALELLGQGGVATLGLTQGGVFKRARIEHVWVEAFVDFVPSRGAKHVAGDTWVPMDAAFKQYTLTDGVDLAGSVDVQPFATELQNTTNSNAAEGWIQGVDFARVDQQMAALTQQLQQRIDSEGADATLADVVGSKRIAVATLTSLSTALPHLSAVPAARHSALTSAVRWKFRFALDGQTMLERSLPSLAGKSLALSFKPATSADEQALKSLIPANADGPEDLPKSIPSSLAKLVPELSIDGSSIAAGTAHSIGADVFTRKGLYIPNQGWQETDNPLVVGDYHGIAIDLVGTSSADVTALRAQALETQRKLENQEFAAVSKHDVTGAIMQAGALNFFAQTHSKIKVMGQVQGVLTYALPSYGTVSSNSQVQYWFGMPRTYIPNGVLMDMDRVASITVAKDGSEEKWKHFNQAAGAILSGHEASTLEELVDDRSTPVSDAFGISATRLVSLAMNQGQRIYTIKSENLAQALSSINLPIEAEQEIASAVSAGKVVTAHANLLAVAGQSTAGYYVIDADTGAGAYKLVTGADGGFVDWVGDNDGLVAIIGIILGLIAVFASGAVAIIAGIAGIILGLVSLYTSIRELVDILNQAGCPPAAEGLIWLVVGISLLALLPFGPGGIIALAILGYLMDQLAKSIAEWMLNTGFCRPPETP
jgi:transglutaminase-like putative cysteine protease